MILNDADAAVLRKSVSEQGATQGLVMMLT